MRFGLRAVETPVFRFVGFRALFGKFMHDLPRELDGVRVAEHVPLPDDTAHACQLNAEGLEDAFAAALETLSTCRDLFANGFIVRQREARILPVTMGEHDTRHLALDDLGLPQAARDEESGSALKIDLLDREPIPLDFTVNDRVEWCLGRHGPQTLRHEDPAPNLISAHVPFAQG